MSTVKINKSMQFVKTHKLVTALLFLVVVGLGFWGYQAYAKHANKVAFEQARSAIDTIYADIVAKVGQPDDNKVSRSCSTVQEVYGDGPLSCDLDTSFIYSVADKNSSDQLRQKIKDVVSLHKAELHPIGVPLSAPGIATTAPGDSSLIRDYYTVRGQIQCVITYVFDPTFDTPLEKRNLEEKLYYVDFLCSGPAKATFYSLQH